MENTTETTMANEHHSNPIISIMSGTIFGLYSYLQAGGFIIQDLLELYLVL